MIPHPPLKSAALSTGVRLPYVEQGDPDGVAVILLHGYSDSWRSWELLLPALPGSLHAFAVTQRGHGDAERPADGYRPEDHAADVAAFMDAVGVEQAVLVGHSGGSYTAQRFGLDHPERTLGIVLVGAFHGIGDNPDVAEMADVVAQLTDPVDADFVRGFQESCVAQAVPDGFLDTIVTESRKVPARVWKAYLDAFLAADVPSRSGTIAAPTLLLWGDRDPFCRRSDQEALLAAIPGSTLVVFPGTAHCPQWEQVERTAAEIAGFVARVS